MKAARGIPRIRVHLHGEPLAEPEAGSLHSVRIQQRLSTPTLCTLGFVDPPRDWIAKRVYPGATLEVRLIESSALLFTGHVTAVEHSHEGARGHVMQIRAYDALIHLRMRQSLRRFSELTAEELVRELVAPIGVTVESAVETPFWRNRIQSKETDLELLDDVCRRAGVYFTLRDGVLHLLTLDGVGEPIPLELGKSLLDARLELNQLPRHPTVQALGWDVLSVEAREERSEQPRAPEAIDSSEARLESAAGERFLVDLGLEDPAHARGAAQAELDDRVSRARVFMGTAEGDPSLQVGASVELRHVAASNEGRYVLTRVDHRIDAEHGYVTQIGSEPPPRRAPPQAAQLALGIVSDVADAQDLGRVRVTLPAFGDVETDWLGVLCPAAGAGKGFIALPDVGDSVLVALVHGDPAEGIVLGGLFGRQPPPDAGIHAGAVRRYTLRTPDGQQLKLDDDDRSLRIETTEGSAAEWSPDRAQLESSPHNRLTLEGGRVVLRNRAGSRIELSGDRVIVHAEKELVLRAPGGQVRIQASAIDFEKQ